MINDKAVQKISASEASAQNFYVWVIKQTTGVSKKNRGPKTATRQNIRAASAAPAAPLPTPMIRRTTLCTYTLYVNAPERVMYSTGRRRSTQ